MRQGSCECSPVGSSNGVKPTAVALEASVMGIEQHCVRVGTFSQLIHVGHDGAELDATHRRLFAHVGQVVKKRILAFLQRGLQEHTRNGREEAQVAILARARVALPHQILAFFQRRECQLDFTLRQKAVKDVGQGKCDVFGVGTR